MKQADANVAGLWLQRLREDVEDVEARMARIEAREIPATVDAEERELLARQLGAMRNYLHVLEKRLALHEGGA